MNKTRKLKDRRHQMNRGNDGKTDVCVSEKKEKEIKEIKDYENQEWKGKLIISI